MHKKAVFPGKYIQGAGAMGELPGLVDLLGGTGLILASPTACAGVLPECGVDWAARGGWEVVMLGAVMVTMASPALSGTAQGN